MNRHHRLKPDIMMKVYLMCLYSSIIILSHYYYSPLKDSAFSNILHFSPCLTFVYSILHQQIPKFISPLHSQSAHSFFGYSTIISSTHGVMWPCPFFY